MFCLISQKGLILESNTVKTSQSKLLWDEINLSDLRIKTIADLITQMFHVPVLGFWICHWDAWEDNSSYSSSYYSSNDNTRTSQHLRYRAFSISSIPQLYQKHHQLIKRESATSFQRYIIVMLIIMTITTNCQHLCFIEEKQCLTKINGIAFFMSFKWIPISTTNLRWNFRGFTEWFENNALCFVDWHFAWNHIPDFSQNLSLK